MQERDGEAEDFGRGKRDRTKARNRAAILSAARKVFATQGYEAATVRDIVRGTDLAVGTFYQYFRDKPDVFAAVAQETLSELRERLHRVRVDRSRPFRERLFDTYKAFFEFAIEERPLYEVLDRNLAALESDPSIDSQGASMREIREDFTPDFVGAVPPIRDDDFVAAAIMGTGLTVARVMIDRPQPDATEAAAFCTRFVLAGLDAARSGDDHASLSHKRDTSTSS